MSNSPGGRRPLRLQQESVEEAPRPWRVRTADGQIRGPLGLAQLKSLVDVQIVNASTQIAPAGEEAWVAISTHELWTELAPKKKTVAFRDAELVEEAPSMPASTVRVAPHMQARMTIAREKELNKVYRGLMYWRLSRAARVVRAVLVFLGFVTFGDLCLSFLSDSLGIVKLCVALAILAAATAYYSYKAFQK
jgi:hypothetical protein